MSATSPFSEPPVGSRGRWARRLPGPLHRAWRSLRPFVGDGVETTYRRAMTGFYLDGVLTTASEAFVGSFLTLYLVALGASAPQIGLLASLSSLAGVLLLVPGARLADRFPNHRKLVVVASLGNRAALGLLVVAAWVPSPQMAIAAIIALATLRSVFGNLSQPAWTDMAARIVPEPLRGRFFSNRTFGMSLATVCLLPLAGRLIGLFPRPTGYQVSFAIATAVGLGSSYAYARIPDLPPEPAAQRKPDRSWRKALAELRNYPDFVRFAGIALVLGVGVYLSAPFATVYMARGLHMSDALIGLAIAIQSLGDMFGQRIWGPLVDKRGSRWTMCVTAPLIALSTLAWLLIRQPWQVFPVNLLGSVAWAGNALAIFNYLLLATPAHERPLYSAIYNTFAAIASMAGPLFGGFIYARWGFSTVLWLSGLGRGLAAVLMILFVRELSDRFAKRPATV